MQPAERLLAHILVKPTCALIDPGQVEDGRGELVKSHNLRFAGKPEIPLWQMKLPDVVCTTLIFLILGCNPS